MPKSRVKNIQKLYTLNLYFYITRFKNKTRKLSEYVLAVHEVALCTVNSNHRLQKPLFNLSVVLHHMKMYMVSQIIFNNSY